MRKLFILLAVATVVYTENDMRRAYVNGMLDARMLKIGTYQVVGKEGICSVNLEAKEIDCVYTSFRACHAKEILCGSTINYRIEHLPSPDEIKHQAGIK